MCTAKRDVVYGAVVYIRLRVSQWMWCAYRGCRTVNIGCNIASATHRKSLDITDADEYTPGGTSRRTARICATRWRYSVQTGRAPSQPPEVGGTLHKRELAVPSPVSSVTPLHCSCTQGKAAGKARHGHHTSHRYKHEPRRRERREREVAGAGKLGSDSRPIHAVPLGRCHG